VPTITSRLPALIDYLVSLFKNAATLGAAPPPNNVTVYDGQVITEDPENLILWVGMSDPSIPDQAAADFTQEWAALGRRGRNETVTIHCCAVGWGAGENSVAAARVAACGIVAAVETLMQADATQFGGNVLYPMPGVAAGALTQLSTDRGPAARVAFDLVFRNRIGG
jgi:hypothetical protein